MVGDMGDDGDLEFRTLPEKRIEAAIVSVQSFAPRQLSSAETHSFVGQLADATRAFAITALQLRRGAFRIIRLIDVRREHTAEQLKPVRAGRVQLGHSIELFAG